MCSQGSQVLEYALEGDRKPNEKAFSLEQQLRQHAGRQNLISSAIVHPFLCSLRTMLAWQEMGLSRGSLACCLPMVSLTVYSTFLQVRIGF